MWDTDVVPAAIDLVQRALPKLSSGFGDGVVVVFVALWVGSLGAFAGFLNTGHVGLLFATAFNSMLPVLLALDVASASSACDHIRSTLNDKRAEAMTVEADAKIQVVERLLSNANRGQGLGFVAGGRVIDRTTLQNIAAGVAGTLGAILPIILALQPKHITDGTDTCELTATQIATVKAAMVGANESCIFNQTISGTLAL